jgi:hypothetical protein
MSQNRVELTTFDPLRSYRSLRITWIFYVEHQQAKRSALPGKRVWGRWGLLISWLDTSVDGDGVEASRILNFNQSISLTGAPLSCIVVL